MEWNQIYVKFLHSLLRAKKELTLYQKRRHSQNRKSTGPQASPCPLGWARSRHESPAALSGGWLASVCQGQRNSICSDPNTSDLCSLVSFFLYK